LCGEVNGARCKTKEKRGFFTHDSSGDLVCFISYYFITTLDLTLFYVFSLVFGVIAILSFTTSAEDLIDQLPFSSNSLSDRVRLV
jgi:hypothetical protein